MSGSIGPVRDLGPCQILFNSVDLGVTNGGVKFRYSEEDTPVMEDQEGTASVDDIITGYTCEAEVPLTRMGLSSLNTLLAGCSGSGTDVASGSISVKASVGTSRYDNAYELVLKPIVDGVASTTSSEWLHIWKASARPDFELLYDATGQRVYKFLFKGYADRTSGVATKRIWGIGPLHV